MNGKYLASALVGGAVVYVALAMRVPLPDGLVLGELVTDPVPPVLAETSGTRLKAKVVTGADGSQIFDPEVLFDTQLDADCEFRLATDDTLRCLPVLEPDAMLGTGRINFTDSACTQGFVWLEPPPGGCTLTPPKYVYTYKPAPYCGVPSEQELLMRVYPVGALIGRPAGPHYHKNGRDECVSGGTGQQDWVAYALEGELPGSAFVAGTAGSGP